MLKAWLVDVEMWAKLLLRNCSVKAKVVWKGLYRSNHIFKDIPNTSIQ